MLRSPTRALPALVLSALLAACGGGGDKVTGPGGSGGANTTGTFSGNISGGVSRSLTGVAYYANVNDGDTGFGIGMGTLAADKNSFTDMVAMARTKSGLPSAGSHRLHNGASDADPTDDEFVLVSTLQMPNGGQLICLATTGTVTFQAPSNGHVRGSYSTQASCLNMADPEAEISATLSGSFDAVEASRIPQSARSVGASSAHALSARLRAARQAAR